MEVVGLVINLDSRLDRWNQIQETFKNIKSIKLERVSAVNNPENPRDGCIRSHQKAIQIAKERNYLFALVIEDDCLIQQSENFDQRFTDILSWLNSNEWKIFNGGPTFIRPEKLRVIQNSPPIFELFNCGYAAHFIMYNSSVYEDMLNYYTPETKFKLEDHTLDIFIVKKFNQICTYPILASQKESYSDIMKTYVNYNNVFVISNLILSRFL